MPRTRLYTSKRGKGTRKGTIKTNPARAPGVGAVLRRARTPYKRNPLSEDEALNLVCDARSDEPTYLIEKLFKKFGDGLER
jgi:hypothetical protein